VTGSSLGGDSLKDKLITIATFRMPMPDPGGMAELAKLELKFADIPCFLSGRSFTETYWLYSVIDRGISLQVKCSDAERALAILEGTVDYPVPPPSDIEIAEDDETEPDFFVCPECSATDITYEKFSRLAFYLSILLFKVPLTFLKRTYRCNACSHTWK
jgi:hypothetical protein